MPSDFITRAIRLAIANRPGPGRPLGRLRLSLGTAIADLTKLYGQRPAEIRLASVPGDAGRLSLTTGDRAFLSPAQVRRLGGFDRAGENVRLQFLYPLKRHVFDVTYGAVDGHEAGDELNVAGSGFGITFRVVEKSRGDPMEKLRTINYRLRKHFEAWLRDFPGAPSIASGDVSKASLPPQGPNGRRWMVQIVRARGNRAGIESNSADGLVIWHSDTLGTRFKVLHNDLTGTSRPGDVFTET